MEILNFTPSDFTQLCFSSILFVLLFLAYPVYLVYLLEQEIPFLFKLALKIK